MNSRLVTLALALSLALAGLAAGQRIWKDEPRAIVFPLKGTVGLWGLSDRDPSRSQWFTAKQLRKMLASAARKYDIVVLEIDSPGGLVIEEMAIFDIINEYRDDVEIIAFPHDAFSAAANITMGCDHLVVSNDSSVGAAVVVLAGDAVDAKYAAANAADVRNFFASAGRPGVIADAMSLLESELWYSKVLNAFSGEAQSGGDWVQLDGPESVLAFDARQLLETRLAIGHAQSAEEAAALLSSNVKVTRGDDYVKRLLKSARSSVKGFRAEYEQLLFGIEDDLPKLLSELQDSNSHTLKNNQKRYRERVFALHQQADNIRMKNQRGDYDCYLPDEFIDCMMNTVHRYTEQLLDAGTRPEGRAKANEILERMYNRLSSCHDTQ